MLVVQKYGGTSVGDPERIKNVAKRVVKRYKEGNDMVVVISAMGHTTDELIDLMKKVTNNPDDREVDVLLSTGEQVTISLLAMAIKDLGCDAISLTGAQAGILTTGVHTKARISGVNKERIKEELKKGRIVVVAGFQGINEHGDITTLGRGGSDTTAVALAVALNADMCEIYTDVDGVYTSDPRIVPEASKLSTISYDEMLELASLGAQVLHPRSVELSKLYGVKLQVRSSFNENPGTIIQEVTDMEKSMMVSGVAYDKNIAKIGLYNVPVRKRLAFEIFKALADKNVNVDIIVQTASHGDVKDMSFTIAKDDLRKALVVIESLQHKINFEGYTHDEDVAKVSIVGAGMISNPGVAAMMFEALADEGINIEMITTSEIKVSCVIKDTDVERAVKAIHKKFNLDKIYYVVKKLQL
ncbi:aspartate kinase [Peptococcaceae bacterium]|nr:aspartate kinase [Peptococcaceae bacterium]